MRRWSCCWALLFTMCLPVVSVCSSTAYAQVEAQTAAETIKLRVPKTTVHFDLVETPAGSVTLDDATTEVDPLLVLTTELPWDLYDIFIYELDQPDGSSPADAVSRPSKPYVPPDRGFGHDGYPAIGMTRKAAEQFCQWLSLKLGVTVRLPQQHEWVYLAQGGEERDYCCGVEADTLDRVAWFKDNSEHTTHPVAQKAPNAFGLFDIHGNAAEWVMTETRRPYAMGGGYRDTAEDSKATSAQRQASSWNQSDPQIPKSQWWLADCSWVGFRFVIDATDEHKQALKEFSDE